MGILQVQWMSKGRIKAMTESWILQSFQGTTNTWKELIFLINKQWCKLCTRKPWEILLQAFGDYIDMGRANSLIINEKIVSKLSVKAKKIPPRRKKVSKAWADWWLLIKEKNTRSQPRHRIEYVKKHGRCKRRFQIEKINRKCFIK